MCGLDWEGVEEKGKRDGFHPFSFLSTCYQSYTYIRRTLKLFHKKNAQISFVPFCAAIFERGKEMLLR